MRLAGLAGRHRLGLLERSALRAHHPGRKGPGAVLRLGQRMTRSRIERITEATLPGAVGTVRHLLAASTATSRRG